jgi:hypothetical protein
MQMTRTNLIAVFLIGMACAGLHPASAKASAKECTKEQAIKAAVAADHLKTWDAVYQWFYKFKQCDDHNGEHAESLDDAVAKLFANDWKHFPRFAELSKKDTRFRIFVLSYIGATADPDDLEAVSKNAQQHCLPNAKTLCKAIETRLNEIEKEIQNDDFTK